jgi:hypothetical protein
MYIAASQRGSHVELKPVTVHHCFFLTRASGVYRFFELSVFLYFRSPADKVYRKRPVPQIGSMIVRDFF